MKTIELTKGKVALIDDQDFEILNKFKWYWDNKKRSRNGYAATDLHNRDNEFGVRHVSMHRMILKPDRSLIVDHINGDGLDNRKENLRVCDHTQNNGNFPVIGKRNKSGYKGVSWHKKTNKWRSSLLFRGKQHHLGLFSDPVEAALAYNAEAIKYFGEFSRINII